MFEKVNPSHPDKVADRIAGAIVDLCYEKNDSPKAAVEVLLGHGLCTVIAETSEVITEHEVSEIVHRIAGEQEVRFMCVKQDIHLALNQSGGVRCGDNGIFKGCPTTEEQARLSDIALNIFSLYPTDGKYILHGNRLTICQSNAEESVLREIYPSAVINPLGPWTGGSNVDSGATNRKLGSDMGDGVTGGGLHGKDLSKADVSVNIYCHLSAQSTGKVVTACCAIGDETVEVYVGGEPRLVPYVEIVELARGYVNRIGGFERFAEWGLIR